MGTLRQFCVMAIAAGIAALAGAEPSVVKKAYKTTDLVIAEEIVHAPAAGADASAAIQAAVDRIGKTGGGTVFLPVGRYTLANPIVVREGVTLRGDNDPATPAESTVLCVTAGKGDADGPAAVTVERGSGLRGLVFWYPEQKLPDPVPYPWTVASADMPDNDNQTVEDCVFVNSWRGIRIGPSGNELHTLRRLIICALDTGISVDSTTDIGRVTDVKIGPFWENFPGSPEADDVLAHMSAHATGADFGRSDWEFIRGLTVVSCRVGVVFRKGRMGVSNAVMTDSTLGKCGTPLRIEALNEVGLALYNCEIGAGAQGAMTSAGFDSVVQFHSCKFIENTPAKFDGHGVVALQRCEANDIEVAGGQFLLSDSQARTVRLGEKVVRARVLGSGAKVENAAPNADVMVSKTVKREGRETKFLEMPHIPTPLGNSRGDFYCVTNFGASAAAADNAAAFQKVLDVAGKTGGTVYVPAGLYNFKAGITVPKGVELRGCSDVPHHTVSAGSVLMIRCGAGQEGGEPFVKLAAQSGLRGLTFWYPEQTPNAPVPYPWTVRSLGEGCRLVDVDVGNAWQAVDFATNPSDGHFIAYLSGAMFRRGLFVGKSAGGGYVEDVQFNPHYMARIPKDLPHVPGDFGGVINYQREHLDGIVFTDCIKEKVVGTFLYAARDGIAFHGKTDADVLIHGTDAASRAFVLDTAKGSRVNVALAQLVTLGDWAEGAIIATPGDYGDSVFAASQFWPDYPTLIQRGMGKVRLEEFNTVSGEAHVENGTADLQNGVFHRPLPAHVAVTGEGRARVSGCVYREGTFRMSGAVEAFAVSADTRLDKSLAALGAKVAFTAAFEAGEQGLFENRLATGVLGGCRKVSGWSCAAEERGDAHDGKRALRLRGISDDPSYSFIYSVIAEPGVTVFPDTELRYWVKPLSEQGRSVSIDLGFDDSRMLRDSGISPNAAPGSKKAAVGEWRELSVPLGKYTGRKIVAMTAAYDSRRGGGPIDALFDGVRIESVRAGNGAGNWTLRPEIKDGAAVFPAEYKLPIRYTLDGSNPSEGSLVANGPVALPKDGPRELRYSPAKADGSVSGLVFGVME